MVFHKIVVLLTDNPKLLCFVVVVVSLFLVVQQTDFQSKHK